MNKKVFFCGVATGIISSVVAVAGVNFSANAADVRSSRFSIEDKIDYITNLMYKNYVDELDVEALETGVYRGLVEGLGDPYAYYYSAEELEEAVLKSNGVFYGIGVTVQINQETGKMLVVSVVDESPAEDAGILAGDFIIKVNGESIIGMDLDSSVALIKGEKGTKVNLTIEREGKEVEITSKRDEIDVESVAGAILEDSTVSTFVITSSE